MNAMRAFSCRNSSSFWEDGAGLIISLPRDVRYSLPHEKAGAVKQRNSDSITYAEYDYLSATGDSEN
jgi:hypothetical protein